MDCIVWRQFLSPSHHLLCILSQTKNQLKCAITWRMHSKICICKFNDKSWRLRYFFLSEFFTGWIAECQSCWVSLARQQWVRFIVNADKYRELFSCTEWRKGPKSISQIPLRGGLTSFTHTTKQRQKKNEQNKFYWWKWLKMQMHLAIHSCKLIKEYFLLWIWS